MDKEDNNQDLFQKFVSFENLHSAFEKARRLKKFRRDVLEFEYRLEYNLLNLQKELIGFRDTKSCVSKTYRHGGYRKFMVKDPKKREIKAAPFRDRVVHHALNNIIEPIFDKGFIFDSYACRQGKGTHKAVERLRKFIQSIKTKLALSRESCRNAKSCASTNSGKPRVYCLQCDISQYFASIDHKILFGLIKKKIKDKKLLAVIKKVIRSSYDKIKIEKSASLLKSKKTGEVLKRKTGIPIGNLTSQLFANIYLNELDQFVKHFLSEELKKVEKNFCAFHYYIRYMDDFLFLSLDKKILHQVKERIKDFLENDLRLDLNPKKVNIFPVKNGVDFLGYRIFCSRPVKLRKSTVFRFIKRMKKYQRKDKKPETVWQSFQSWRGYAKHGNSFRLQQSLKKKYEIFRVLGEGQNKYNAYAKTNSLS